MAGEPDVRVRLTAEGVAEVIAAFRKVQAELVATQAKAKAASAGAAGPTDFFSKLTGGAIDFKGALAGVSSAFAAVGIAMSAVKLIEFAKAGIDAAEATTHLAQSLGVTIENLQALQELGRSSGIDPEKLQTGFAKLADSLANLRDGLPDAVARFRQLGLATKDFNGKDLAEAIQLVARAVSGLPPAEQFRAMRDFFSDRSGSLLPFINELGQGKQALQDIVQRYKDLGLVLDGKVVKSAAKVGDAFGAMGKQLSNMAVEFVGSAAPGLVDALEHMLEIGSKNKDLFANLGRIFGAVLAPAVSIVLILVRTLGGLLAGTADALVTIGEVAKDVVSDFLHNNGKAADTGKKLVDNLKREMHGLSATVKDDMVLAADALKQVLNGPKQLEVDADKRATAGGEQKVTAQGFKDRLDALKSAQEAELALLKARNALKEETEKEAFDRGLETLKQFYADRRQIITEEQNKEIAQLNAQLAQQAFNPDQAQAAKEIDRLKQQKKLVETRAALAQAQLDVKELADRKNLNERIAQIERQGVVDEQRIFQQKIDNIIHQGLDLEVALQQIGLSAEAAARQREGFTTNESAKVLSEGSIQKVDRMFADLQHQRDLIQLDIQAGLKSQVLGELEIVRLEQNRLPALRAAGLEMLKLAEATHDVDLQTKATDMITSLDEVERHVQSAEFSFTKLKAAAIDAAHAGLVSFLTTATDQFHDLGDAALAAANQVAEALRRMAAEEVATDIFKFLGFSVPGHAAGGAVKKASGGVVQGPGTETSDSVPAMLSRGEFVVRASSVRKPGVLPLLERINSNVVSAGASILRKAAGGLIGPTREASDAFTPLLRQLDRRIASGRSHAAIVKKASGGVVFGAGTETSDSVPAMLSRGEFVVRAAAVRRPGVLPLLSQINVGSITHADVLTMQRGMQARIDHRDFTESLRAHFAEGGLASPLDGRMFDDGPGSTGRSPSMMSPAVHGKLQIGLSEGLVIDHMKSPAGQRAWLEVLTKNRRMVQGIVQPGGR